MADGAAQRALCPRVAVLGTRGADEDARSAGAEHLAALLATCDASVQQSTLDRHRGVGR